MARVKLPEELKKAITTLSPREKDKLLFRLIAKDPSLVERLNFELLETGEGVTKEDRRSELKVTITSYLDKYKKHYYSPGYLLLNLRHLSGMITKHLKMTKDNYGDISLNFLMLNHCFRLFRAEIQQATPQKSYTLNSYVVKRALRLLKQLSKMHEDYVLDFEEDMKELGRHIKNSHTTMKIATQHQLDVNCLIEGKIPN